MHKAVTPVEATRVDKMDTFFEVLFAREESNREGSAGGGRSLRSCLLPTYRQQGVHNPGSSLQPACTVHSLGLCLESGAGSIAGSHRGWPHLSSGYKEQGLGCGEGEGAIFLGSATRGAGTVVSSGLEEPQRTRLQPESILSSRYGC